MRKSRKTHSDLAPPPPLSLPPLTLSAANITLAEAQNALASLPTANAAAAVAAAQRASSSLCIGLLSSIPGASSGAALLRAEAHSALHLPKIITFCAGLDRVLGGGIARGSVTEVCGPPGVGKTQLAMQSALDAAIPRAFGGAGGESLIIDSEGSILPERAAAMAVALSKHLRRVVSRAEAAAAAAAEAAGRAPMTEEASAAAAGTAADAAAKRAAADASGSAASLLSSVKVLRVRDAAELVAAVASLPALCERHPRLALVAVDSVAFVWRASGWNGGLSSCSISSSSTTSRTAAAANAAASSSSSSSSAAQTASRARALSSLAASLSTLAREKGLAVLLTNQVTTRPVALVDRLSFHQDQNDQNALPPSASSSSSSVLVPALGDSWGHVPTTRLMLSWSWQQQQQQQEHGVGNASSTSSSFSSSSSRQRRVAELVKSPSLPPGRAEFEVTGEGIRGPRSSGGGGGGGGGREGAAATAGSKRPLAALP